MTELLNALRLINEGHPGQAHVIVQDDHTPEGAYLHGMIHREQGDLGNAKYWFARSGDVPARLGVDPMDVDQDVERTALTHLLKA